MFVTLNYEYLVLLISFAPVPSFDKVRQNIVLNEEEIKKIGNFFSHISSEVAPQVGPRVGVSRVLLVAGISRVI